MKHMTIQEVIDYLKTDDTNDDFAFRGDDYIPVSKFKNSRTHRDDEPERTLPGVSALAIQMENYQYISKLVKNARSYGRNVFLLRGVAIRPDNADYDLGECLMTHHSIVCMVD